MSVNKKEIVHLAKLSNLYLSEEEIEKYAKDLTEIIDFASMINSVNTDEINETIAANENFNVFRKDQVIPSMDRNLLLQNAPSQDDGMFRIPKVLN
ncbi:MAG: Asp-tRNA(Asn)/Glu-tRNA(Gln) amidotransferase subunit GatC [Clostridia bacterium]|nr:Asp-tRNA(Asn)/Glu-tRNA(Gln) amidotransferase subunit GatC [Clostridia bacterium]